MKRGAIGLHLFKLKNGFFSLALALISATPAYSQSDTARTLNEVAIKGNKAPTIRSITPAQRITSTDFVKTGSFNVADAVRNFSGVNVKDYGGIGGIKTISVRGLGASHTAVFYDGLQLNDAQTGQIDLSKLNLGNIQSITLYNGQPDDLLQPARAFASASVLNLQTQPERLSPDENYKITTGLKGGSFGLFNPSVFWQQRISKNWSAVVSANYINANGRYKFRTTGDGSDSLSTRHNSQVRSVQTDAALYWHKNDSTAFSVHVNYYNAKRGLPGAVIYYSESPGEKLNNDDVFVQASYKHIWKNNLKLLLSSKLSQLKTRYLDSPFYNARGYILDHYKQQEVYQSAAVAYKLTNTWTVLYSADASLAKVDADIDNYAYPKRLTLLNAVASDLKLGKWQLGGNLLYTYLHEKVEMGTAFQQKPVLSPTVMASVQPLAFQGFKIRAFYKGIFRAPTLDELYYFAVIPRDIQPEFVKQFDIGTTYYKEFDGLINYINLTADAYYNRVTNKIIAVPSQNPAVFSFSNVGKVDIKGLDIGLKTATRNVNNWNITFAANYTYQEALDVTGPTGQNYLEQIPYTPRHTIAINTGINYKNIAVYYNQIISSHRNYSGNDAEAYRLPGYAVGDVSAIYNAHINRLPFRLTAEVSNVFNRYYSIVQSYPMPGRSIRLATQITI